MIQDDFVDGRILMFVSVHRFFLQVNVFVCKPKLPHVAPASSFKVTMVGAKLQRQLAPTHKSTAIAPNKTCIQTCATAQLRRYLFDRIFRDNYVALVLDRS